MGYSNVAGDLNVLSTISTQNLIVRGDTSMYGNLSHMTGLTSLGNVTATNLTVTGNFTITATNTQVTNALSINNAGTATALKVVQYEGGGPGHAWNVAEFWDYHTLAMIIDPEGNVGIHTTSSPGYALTVVDGSYLTTVTSQLYIGNGSAISNINSSNLVGPLTASQLSALQTNITQVGTLTSLNVFPGTSNLSTTNVTTLNAASILGTNLNVTGTANIYDANIANTLFTQNIITTGFTSNSTNTVFNYSTLTVPFVFFTTINAAGNSNLSTTNVTTLNGASILGTNLNVTGTSNLSTTNVTTLNAATANATNMTVRTQANIATLNVFTSGNAAIMNAASLFGGALNVTGTSNLSTTNVTTLNGASIFGTTFTASTQFSGPGTGLTGTATSLTTGLAQNLTGTPNISVGNVYSANSVTTTNVVATGRLESDSTWILGASGTTQRTFRTGRVTGITGVTDTVQGSATVTFGFTASSTTYRVLATVDGLASNFPFAIAVSNKTTTTFDVRVLKINSTSASTVVVDWLLIE
jgi:hypothetical protein